MNKFYSVLGLFILSVLLNFSCTKIDTTLLGSDLIPVVDNVNTFDTTLEVSTDMFFLPDSTRLYSTAGIPDDHALGLISADPSFGSTKGDIYFAISPGTFGVMPFGPKDSIVGIDSVVLQLAYTGVYGDSTAIEQFRVREIAGASNFDVPYNATKTVLIGNRIDTLTSFQTSADLGPVHTQNFVELNDDRVIVRKPTDTTKISNVMRIRLNNSLGQRLLAYDTLGTTGAYRSDSLFRDRFRGLAIQTQSASSGFGGALAYFNLNNTNTQLILYYKKKLVGSTTGLPVDTAFGFILAPSISANLLSRNPGATPYAASVANPSANQPELYLQSSPGSFASLKIPGLQGLSNRIIHRAELTFGILPGVNDNIFTAPPLLFLDAVDSANKRYQTISPDFTYDATGSTGFLYNVSYFGGFPQNNRFWFNISRYVQGIVTKGNKNFTLRLYAPYQTTPYVESLAASPDLQLSTKIGFGRVIVAGGSHPDPTKKLRLRIIYSKI